jgi:crotonobetainyl-CoA:carnitine CoA-transferase CaiB-like acyl-CoA transferase
MPGPLDGLRVVDCTTGTAGPRAAGILADYGADVLRVEPPGGDRHRVALAVEYSVANRNKRTVELDLREDSGRAVVDGLLAGADVLLTSWRPGVAESLGLDAQALRPRFPTLVSATVSGYGPSVDSSLASSLGGPDLAGHESLVHAVVGTMGEQAGMREGPIYEGLPFAGIGAAYLAVIATLAALHRRAEDGLGRAVETSLVDGALAYLSMLWADDEASSGWHGSGVRRLISRAFECADGEYLGVHTGASGAFGRLMAALGLDEHFPPVEGPEMAQPLTEVQRGVVREDTVTVFASKPRDAWLRILEEADVCAVPELRPGEVFDAPQARHNGMVVRVDDPVLGPLDQVGPPLAFALTPHRPPVAVHAAEAPGWRRAERWAVPAAAPDPDRPLLGGLKILDFGAYYAGPYASRLLADLGADVVKLEPPVGDQLRGLDRPFGSAQAGKRSIALDLKDPDARAAAQDLAARVDLVQHNMRPGAAERIGLGYADVRARNPQVVYAYSPGWGSSGPFVHRQSFAPLVSGYVGVNFEVAGQFNPPLFPVGNEDPGNGLVGAVGMLMALLHRRRTGAGQYFEHPQLNATMTHVAHIVRRPDGKVLGAGRLDPLQFGIGALDRLYETADGWLCLSAATPEHLAGLAKVLGVEIDPRRAGAAPGAPDDDVALAGDLAEAFAARPTEELRAELLDAGVPVAVPAPRNDRTFLRDPHNEHTRRVGVSVHPTRGTVRELSQLMRVSDVPVREHRHAPLLGEHTDELLAMVGRTAGQIAALRERGAAR